MTSDWRTVEGPGGERHVLAEIGDGPPVILMHGFPDTPHGLERIATALAEAGYRAVRPWLRGYRPETVVAGRGYDVVTIGSDPIRLLDALGLDDAILVGHDWGAFEAYGAATLHPDRVRAIVPIAISHPADTPRTPSVFWDARHFFGLKVPWVRWKVRRHDFAYFDRVYRRWAPNWSGPDRDASLAHAKRALSDPIALREALAYYRDLSLRPMPEYRRPPDVPGLGVAGTTDLDPAIYEASARHLGPGSESLIVAGAGHWPHREDEPTFIARLLEFVRARF